MNKWYRKIYKKLNSKNSNFVHKEKLKFFFLEIILYHLFIAYVSSNGRINMIAGSSDRPRFEHFTILSIVVRVVSYNEFGQKICGCSAYR